MFQSDDGGAQKQMILEKIMELLSQLPDKEDVPPPAGEPGKEAAVEVIGIGDPKDEKHKEVC